MLNCYDFMLFIIEYMYNKNLLIYRVIYISKFKNLKKFIMGNFKM